MTKVLPDCLCARLYGKVRDMGTTIVIAFLVVAFWAYYAGRGDGARRAKEEAERKSAEVNDRPSRDPIHDVMID